MRREKLVAQFRKCHPLARQAHLEQSQCDFAFPFLEYFHGDFFAGSLGRLKRAFLVHRIAHPPEPRTVSSIQAHSSLFLLARGVSRRNYTRGARATASGLRVIFFKFIERGPAIFEPSAKLAALDLLAA